MSNVLQISTQSKGCTVYIQVILSQQNYDEAEEHSQERLFHCHVHIIPRNDKDLDHPDDIYQFIDGYDKEQVRLTSFLRFYKSKIIPKNAISKQAEDNIRADAQKIYKLTQEQLTNLDFEGPN